MKKILTLTLMFISLGMMTMHAQPTGYARDMSTDPGWSSQPDNYVLFSVSNGELLVRDTVINGIEASYSMIQIWWGPQDWGIKIKEAPYLKFRAKSPKNKSYSFVINYYFTDGTTQGVSKNITLTNTYQDFFYNLSTDIATLEMTGKTVKNCYEFQVHLDPARLSPAFRDTVYFDYFAIGDSANPCPNKRPTLGTLPAAISRNFNAITPSEVALSGISDNNGGKFSMTVTAKSSDSSIVPHPVVIYNSPDATGTMQIIGAQPPKSGTVTITVTVTNDTAYCNSKTSKTMQVTVKPEALWFVLPTFSLFPSTMYTKYVDPAMGEQSIVISGITNIGKNNVPDNYRGLSMTASAVSNGAWLTSYTENLTIDTLTGTAEFKFTVSPDAPEGTEIKVNFVLASATGKKTSPTNTSDPKATLTISVKKGIGLEPAVEEQLAVYPNPASEIIYINLPQGTETVEITNVAGVVVKSFDVKGQKGTIALSTAGLASGNYVIRAGKKSASVVIK